MNLKRCYKNTKILKFIKNRRISVSNDDKMRAGVVVEKVNEKVEFEFKLHHHTYCWRYYKVRPKNGEMNPECTDTRYCNYDKVHEDYVYTNAWVSKLIKELSNDETRNKIFATRGIPK